jgi:adenylosuccinate lyase
MDLRAISPLDGRYEAETSPLREFFSEFAYLRGRVRVELEFLSALPETGIIGPLAGEGWPQGLQDFTDEDAQKVKEFEKTTRHDVKAIEYYLREMLPIGLHPYIHFGLTSEDVNNIAQAAALRDARDQVLLPAFDELLESIRGFAGRYRAQPMLARTHGQPAVPTTLGKEFAVYSARLLKCREEMASHRFEAKLTGAVGNFNALQAAAPEVDWTAFGAGFVRRLGLEPNLATTQILPYDNWIRYFESLRLANGILIGFAQDVWMYMSLGFLKQEPVQGEVGSSTMPQKVNPIDFENAEGNLGVANALLDHYSHKLPASRLQRDLSDSSVRRTFGTALGHSLLAWKNLERGMSRLAVDVGRIQSELDGHWEVLTEGAQTILRLAGQAEAFEALQMLARGQKLSEAEFRSWAESIDVEERIRQELLALTPENYIGLAVQITDAILGTDP